MPDAQPVLIEAAINGGTTKARNPHVPLTPDEIRADALRCFDAGATIVHAHNHDIRLSGEEAARAYLAAWAPLLAERPDVLWYPTLCVASGARAKLEHVRLIGEQVPVRMAAVDPGSTNLGSPGEDGLPEGNVYANSYADVREAFAMCEEHGWGPQLAIYEPGFLQCVLTYHRAGRLPTGSMVKFYFGGRRRRRPLLNTSTCSRASTCRGRSRCGAVTSWPRRWRASRSNVAATSTWGSRSTTTPTAPRPTWSWSTKRWPWRARSAAQWRRPPTRSACWHCPARQRAQERQQRGVDLVGSLLLDPVA